MKYSYSLCCILLSSVDAIWVDCKTVGFFLKISKEIGKAWRRSCAQEAREPYTPVASLPSLAFCFSLVPDLLFDCSRVLEYAKIRTVLQSARDLGGFCASLLTFSVRRLNAT